MRILHVDTGTGWRGGQLQVFWLIQGLHKQGHEQLLLAPANSPLFEHVRKEGLEVAELVLPTLSLSNVRALRRQAGSFNILHVHDSHAHSLAWLAGIGKAKKRSPFLVVARRVGFPIGALGRLKYAAADAYIAVSEYVGQRLLDAQVPARKIHVVYDGVEPPAWSNPSGERGEFRSRQGVKEGTFLLGTLASVAPEKLLEEEVALLGSLPPSVHLWLGQSANEREAAPEAALLEYARRQGLEQRFRVFHLDDDLQAFLASLDLFLYLSKSEGLGSAILLAMAHGLPVIASGVGGIPEIVRHQQTGLLVGEDPQTELPGAIRLLVGSPEIRRRLAAAGRNFVLANATSDIMVAKTEAIYRELLQGSNSQSE